MRVTQFPLPLATVMSRDIPNKPERDGQTAQARKEGYGAALVAFERETIWIAPDAEVAQLRGAEPPLPASFLWTGRDEYGRIVITRAEAAVLERLNARRKGFCSHTVEGLALSTHCGIVRLNTPATPGASASPITLEILPMLWGGAVAGADAAERAAELGAARRALLRMLARTTGLPVSEPDITRPVSENTALLDLFVRSFLREALRVTKHGLLTRDVGAPHEGLIVDNPYNQALLAAFEISRTNIRHTSTERLWVDARAMFASVSSVRMTARQVAQLKHGKETIRYRAALRWAELLLDLLWPSSAEGRAGVRSLLFDMEGQIEGAASSSQLPDLAAGQANRQDRHRTGRHRYLSATPSDHEQRC